MYKNLTSSKPQNGSIYIQSKGDAKSDTKYNISTKMYTIETDVKDEELYKVILNKAIRFFKQSLKIRKLANEAFAMNTTLWFEEKMNEADAKDFSTQQDHIMNKIIALGQYYTCMGLLEHIMHIKTRLHRKEIDMDASEKQNMNQLEDQLLRDMVKFNEDPMFIIKIQRERRLT